MQDLRFWLSVRKKFWREYFFSGEWELRELRKHVRKNSVAIDVGANIGSYSYHLARFARHVYAFEANPLLVARFERLRLRRVSVECAALSSSVGIGHLRFPMLASGREDIGMASLEKSAVEDAALSREIEVPLRRLDDYGFEGVSFIKIDVEGHEEEVLTGAAATIARERPTLLIEVEERHNQGGLGRIAQKLAALGYQGYFFDKGVRRPLGEFDPVKHQLTTSALDDAGHNRRAMAYINNFLFCPSPQLGTVEN